jgi:hypothetical protein
MSRWPRIIICLMLLGAAALHSMAAAAQSERPPGESTAAARDDLSIELVDPKVLRVCADPRNLPFSNQNGEGFENKLAEFLGAKFNKQVAYTWYPHAPGFVRNTLAALKCDVIIGYPQGSDVVQTTNPYYRTTYTLVFKPGRGLDDIPWLIRGSRRPKLSCRTPLLLCAKQHRGRADIRTAPAFHLAVTD